MFGDAGCHVLRNSNSEAGAPDDEDETCNCSFLAHLLIRPELDTPMRIRGSIRRLSDAQRDQLIEGSNRCLRDLGSEAVVISAEAFSFLRTPGERKDFEALFDGLDVRPIVVLREAGEWRRSWRHQVEKSGLIRHPSSRPGTGIFDFSHNSWLTDHQALRQIFGLTGRYIDYAEVLDRFGSTVPAVLEAMGSVPEAFPSWDGYFLNRQTDFTFIKKI